MRYLKKKIALCTVSSHLGASWKSRVHPEKELLLSLDSVVYPYNNVQILSAENLHLSSGIGSNTTNKCASLWL